MYCHTEVEPTRHLACLGSTVTNLTQGHCLVDVFDLWLSNHQAVVLSLHTRLKVTNLKYPKVNYRHLITETNMNKFTSSLSAAIWDERMEPEQNFIHFLIISLIYMKYVFLIGSSYTKAISFTKKVISHHF